ncbi:hypothetical protein [Goodfellowiella coeruleoviolacea]|uniref:Uncharacterized protein n=1 Tax=Goodfellowiella coeruleoviolacea TaxID=334858 RepID=A0AAE3KJV1_9PSEU|nr:hypothetical protein [Goodfellowiella coeruleoviolacea]MCP2168709.1 hypothetical protein [Goodfellowiella coeruleoviolacea]
MGEQQQEPSRRPRHRRRVAEVFGDVLPDTTRDERDPGEQTPDREAWYRENRPPHHEDR